MIIDEHRHIGLCGSRGVITKEDILGELDRLKVDCAVLAPGQRPVDEDTISFEKEVSRTQDAYHLAEDYLETGRTTPEVAAAQRDVPYHDDVLDAVRTSNGRLLGCWFVNPHLGREARDEARRMVSKFHLRYLKLHPPLHLFAADDVALLEPTAELAAELDVPLWFHSNSGPGTEVERLVRFARRFCNVDVVMGHVLIPGLIPEETNTPAVIDAANAVPNLWVDLSSCPPTSLKRVLAECPRERLLMATDTPWDGVPLEDMMRMIREFANRDNDLIGKVMGENAARLLKIDGCTPDGKEQSS